MRTILAAVLVSLPWLFLIGGGISMCVLYGPGERIDAIGYVILAVMITPLLAFYMLAIIWSWWRPHPDLDVDCTWCGRSLFSHELPKLRQTRRCPGCGHTVPSEDLEDLE